MSELPVIERCLLAIVGRLNNAVNVPTQRATIDYARSQDHASRVLLSPPAAIVLYGGQEFERNIPHGAARQPPTVTIDILISGRVHNDCGPGEISVHGLAETAVNALLDFTPLPAFHGRMIIVEEELEEALPSALLLRQSWRLRLSTPLRERNQ